MAGFESVAQMVDAHLSGAEKYTQWRKTFSQVTSPGIWFDVTLSPGNPKPVYYASTPLAAAPLKYSTDGGIWHGQPVSPKQKHLRRFMIIAASATGLPIPGILSDYLMYYPFCDMGEASAQTMNNAQTLPRYTDGNGVQIMPVLVGAGAGGQTFRVTYTNQDGVAGRVTPVVIMNTATATGTIINAQTANALAAGPFMPLQGSDSGVRSIESVEMVSGTDVGLFTLVLVKPLLSFNVLETTAPSEYDALLHTAAVPQIYDDAFLSFICLPQGSLLNMIFHGELIAAWN